MYGDTKILVLLINLKISLLPFSFFIFGKKTEELQKLREKGYNPWDIANASKDLMNVLEAIRDNIFDASHPDEFKELYKELTDNGDFYFYLADFEDYIICNEKVDSLYQSKNDWAEKALLNVSRMAWFSSDRSIQDYSDQIWHLLKTPITID